MIVSIYQTSVIVAKCWSGLPFPPGHLPNPGIKPVSPVYLKLQADSLLIEP